MRLRGLTLRVARDRSGATIVEFAFLVGPLFLFMFSALDLGYQAYATSMVQGTLYAAARQAALENATTSVTDAFIRDKLSEFAAPTDIHIDSDNFQQFSNIGKPEKLTTDVNKNGLFDANGPDCYIDANKDGSYTTNNQGQDGIGGAEDVVRYKVTISYARLTPLAHMIGMNDPVTISRTTLMRNEPYAGVIDPPTKCGA